jgi:hypothetical protein
METSYCVKLVAFARPLFHLTFLSKFEHQLSSGSETVNVNIIIACHSALNLAETFRNMNEVI